MESPQIFLVGVRVKPGSRTPRVGGSHGGELIVAVAPRAVDGAATEAAAVALAAALGTRRSDVTLRRGARSRSKLFEVRGDPAVLRLRLAELLTHST